MDAGLDQNEAELAVLVLAVALKMLADGDGLKSSSALGHSQLSKRQLSQKHTFLMSM